MNELPDERVERGGAGDGPVVDQPLLHRSIDAALEHAGKLGVGRADEELLVAPMLQGPVVGGKGEPHLFPGSGAGETVGLRELAELRQAVGAVFALQRLTVGERQTVPPLDILGPHQIAVIGMDRAGRGRRLGPQELSEKAHVWIQHRGSPAATPAMHRGVAPGVAPRRQTWLCGPRRSR